jgi:bifunctional DNase/RNase
MLLKGAIDVGGRPGLSEGNRRAGWFIALTTFDGRLIINPVRVRRPQRRHRPVALIPSKAKGATAVVQMELTRIIISENTEQQIIFLREVDGDRNFPIVIGLFEATSIERRVKQQPAARPLTHDLLASTIELLGGELQDIYINELRDHTYYAKLRIRHDGEIVEVDSRPSDAIAVAVTVDVPIYVSEEVLDEVGH